MNSLTGRMGGPALPGARTLARLFAGGAAGLLLWEIWARVVTRIVLGFPLEPAGLIDALFQHNLGISVPTLVREALHYAIGIIGYPLAYLVISRLVKRWSLVLDVLVLVTFTLAIAGHFLRGTAGSGHVLFWIAVCALIASRLVNPTERVRDSISWGTFTWFNALGIMAPLAGLSFYILDDSVGLSFMSFVGHVIYGATAVWLFEWLEAGGGQS